MAPLETAARAALVIDVADLTESEWLLLQKAITVYTIKHRVSTQLFRLQYRHYAQEYRGRKFRD